MTDAFLTAIAKGAGVKDIAKWNRDRKNHTTLEVVKRSKKEAKGLGFKGTPSFGIAYGELGDAVLGSPQSTAQFEEAIEKASKLAKGEG